MDNAQNKFTQQAQETDKEAQIAVPYIPPPTPEEAPQKKFRSPMLNGILIAVFILVGGIMLYNAVGHSLTQLAGISTERTLAPSPTVMPTDTPAPSISPSPSISVSPTP